jgi:DNA-binding transcriptional ArsR family regulator
MSEPEWAQTLAVLYNRVGAVEIPLEEESMHEGHELVESTELSPQEVMETIEYLEKMDLVDTQKIAPADVERDEYGDPVAYSHRKLRLRREGFDVAHDREQGLRQEGSSTAVAMLTGVLAVAAIVQSAVAYSTVTGTWDKRIIGVLLLCMIAVFAISWFQLHRAGILNIKGFSSRIRRFK